MLEHTFCRTFTINDLNEPACSPIPNKQRTLSDRKYILCWTWLTYYSVISHQQLADVL